ncbi:MAG: elongation factor 1-beta [Candidatus Odinarchaeia archaeon]
MGTVLALLKILPEGTEVDLEKVKQEIIDSLPSKFKYHDSKIEPFAFGINQLKMSFTMEDSEGGTEALEDFIKKINGVNEVEVEHVSLI